jgi:hypothetical protein
MVMCTGVVRQSLAMARKFSMAAVIGVVPPVVGAGGGCGAAGGAEGASGLAGGSDSTFLFMCKFV